jgi:cell wall-associated NlpC family hydrolase
VRGLLPMRKAPDQEAEQVNELRYGELITVYEEKEGWAYGQAARDDYVGYVPSMGLVKRLFKPTHRVSAPVTFLFPEPTIKSPPLDRLTCLSAVEVVGAPENFLELRSGGFIHREHVRPITEWRETDPVEVAARLMDVPYLWGGVSPLGCDCSGLVQMALESCGVRAPRDSDMQAAEVGQQVADSDQGTKFQRGDIVCFKGHIGFMADKANLLHANAYHGRVTLELLSDVVRRGSAVTAVRRL